MSIHQYNTRTMYHRNGTSSYVQQHRTPTTDRFARGEARRVDSGGLERKRRQELAEEDMHTAAKRRVLTMEKTTIKMLDKQLDCHREFYDSKAKAEKKIPIKKLLRTKAQKLKALIAAIKRYNEDPPDSDESDEDSPEDDDDEGEGREGSDGEGEL
ncbi:hypothetical protein VTO73DRAFT_9868 [Trametes versicolor]